MNEVSKIHLGRTAFTISSEAYRNLKLYIDEIKKQVKDQGVVEEVELRMAELLTERGISGDKVVLQTDVDFLEAQLGNPQDFKEEGTETEENVDKTSGNKRLFRDTEHGMLAGVASGLSAYTGVDVLLIRVLFVIATLAGAWGLLVYIALWLLVPEAKTSSERLQMAGKPVTVDSLKDIVERADIKGAARRANNVLSGEINSFFRILLKITGVGFIIAGLVALFGLIATVVYTLVHSGDLLQGNIFPVGLREHLLLDIGLAIGVLIAVFIILFGLAMFRRKWPVHSWVTAVLVGLAFIGLAVGGALTADAAPKIRDRYEANTHTTIRNLEPFSKVNVLGKDLTINYEPSDQYSVKLHYFDKPDLSSIKTKVTNGVLVIDSRQYAENRQCNTICLPPTYNMVITVYGPNLPEQPAFPAVYPDPPAKPDMPDQQR